MSRLEFKESKQRDETEKNLRRYEDIVEHVQIGLYVYVLGQSAEGVDELIMAAANPASTLLTGVPSEDIVGRTIDECFPGLREKGIPDLFIEVCRSGRTRRFSDFEYGDDRVLNRVFAGSLDELVASAISLRAPSRAEIDRLHALLDDVEQAHD